MGAWDDDLPQFWGVSNRPFVPPYAPDRFLERLLLSLCIATAVIVLSLALYLRIKLELPQAAWAMSPLLIFVPGWGWASWMARNKRLNAEAKVARYQKAIREISDSF
jgi:hypothetical protein